MYISFCLIVLAAFAGGSVIPVEDCVFPLTGDNWRIFWPLVFRENGSFVELNEGGNVIVPKGDTVLVSCGPNYVAKYQPKRFVTAKCEEDGKFTVENELKLKSAADLGCDLRTIEEMSATVPGCPAEQTGVKFGFVNPADSFTYVTGEACYDIPAGRLLFAHVGLGDISDAALEVQNRNYLTSSPPKASSYKVDFMKAFRLDEFNARLRTALKVQTVPMFDMDRFINTDLLLHPQLVQTMKLPWNYFVRHDDLTNYDLLRKDIGALKTLRDVYTGSSSALTLEDSEGKSVQIYLNSTATVPRFPVPEYIWILVKSGARATAFVVFNNPKLTEEQLQEKSFCESHCSEIRFLKNLGKDERYLNRRRGAVLCCNYAEFREKAEVTLPSLTGITGLLK